MALEVIDGVVYDVTTIVSTTEVKLEDLERQLLDCQNAKASYNVMADEQIRQLDARIAEISALLEAQA